MDGEALVRLLVAAALGAAVGAEREAASHPAGLRTHVTVALGSALFGVITTLGFCEFSSEPGTRSEAARAATQVAVRRPPISVSAPPPPSGYRSVRLSSA